MVTEEPEETTVETTETPTVVEPVVTTEEPAEEVVETVEEAAEETSEEGAAEVEEAEEAAETAAEAEPEVAAEAEEVEETATAKDAKAMWHGFEYDANGNVLHYWESGKIVKERLVKDASTGKKYYFNKYGNPLKNKWQGWKGKRYRLGADGAALTGWKTVEGVKYYFGDGSTSSLTVGALAKGFVKVSGKTY